MQEQFSALCADLEARGYRRNDCAIGGPLAIALSFLLALPFIGLASFLFGRFGVSRIQAQMPRELSFWMVVFIVALSSALAHELMHGVAWAAIGGKGLRGVGFGRQGCWCRLALSKRAYVCGVLTPFAVLGTASLAVMLLLPGTMTLLFTFINLMACGSDLLLALCLAGEKGSLIADNPSQMGYAAFRSQDDSE